MAVFKLDKPFKLEDVTLYIQWMNGDDEPVLVALNKEAYLKVPQTAKIGKLDDYYEVLHNDVSYALHYKKQVLKSVKQTTFMRKKKQESDYITYYEFPQKVPIST